MKIANWAEINGLSMRYRDSGQGRCRLVLIHEMGGSVESWDEVVADLEADFRVVCYDVRGAGLSEKVRAFTIDELASDAVGLLDHLGVNEPVVIAGCAVGAAVAIHAAASYPKRFSGLVAMSAATGIPAERKAQTLAFADKLADGVRAAMSERGDKGFPPELNLSATAKARLRGRKFGSDPESYAAMYRMLATLDLTADYGRIACPAFFLAGRYDKTRPPEVVRAVSDMVPRAHFEIIDSGHAMGGLTPALVAEKLRGVLKTGQH